MLLAKIKGNKVHFGKLVTFLGGRGVNLPPTDPLDPLEVALGGHLQKNFPRGGSAQILSLRGGVRPLRTPLRTSMMLICQILLLKVRIKVLPRTTPNSDLLSFDNKFRFKFIL